MRPVWATFLKHSNRKTLVTRISFLDLCSTSRTTENGRVASWKERDQVEQCQMILSQGHEASQLLASLQAKIREICADSQK